MAVGTHASGGYAQRSGNAFSHESSRGTVPTLDVSICRQLAGHPTPLGPYWGAVLAVRATNVFL